jgi:hypothetical protein
LPYLETPSGRVLSVEDPMLIRKLERGLPTNTP